MIRGRYFLSSRIPFKRNIKGEFFADTLWTKDLRLHFSYIEDTFCAALSFSMKK